MGLGKNHKSFRGSLVADEKHEQPHTQLVLSHGTLLSFRAVQAARELESKHLEGRVKCLQCL